MVQRWHFHILVALAILILLGSCGNSAPRDVEVRGKLLAPNGETPIPGATVFLEKDAVGLSLGEAQGASDCAEPPVPYATYTCTKPDGSFELKFKTVKNQVKLRANKGEFEASFSINLTQRVTDLGAMPLPEDSLPRIAVVTGYYDRMEDLLAKLGLGELENSQLKLGTELFDLFNGDFRLPNGYPDFPELFTDADGDGQIDILDYDIVFINCGTAYENDLINKDSWRRSLHDFVSGGGLLYATDLSYDYVEQVFPEYLDFLGSDGTPANEPETPSMAEQGDGGITTEAEVQDDLLKTWLKNVSCIDSSGNPVGCIDPTSQKVHIEGFLGGWAVINGAHEGMVDDVKFWVQGPVFWGGGSGVKPLTVSFNLGQGRVVYTSYHTEPGSFANGYLPQERILEFLVFQ